MTSKHAIEWLDTIINIPQVCGGNLEDNNKALNKIKKDLEVLEIFRKHTKINALGDIVCDVLFSNINYKGWEEYNEEYKKVKEWLENDK